MNPWILLWELAHGDDDSAGDATIEIDSNDPGVVTLTWPDGSRGVWRWHGGRWEAAGSVDTCPGDVAARDTL